MLKEIINHFISHRHIAVELLIKVKGSIVALQLRNIVLFPLLAPRGEIYEEKIPIMHQ